MGASCHSRAVTGSSSPPPPGPVAAADETARAVDEASVSHDEREPPGAEALGRALVELRPSTVAGPARALRLRSLLDVVVPAAEASTVGRFVLEARVGSGGMGVVYRARDPHSGRAVALKVLSRDLVDDRARFAREVEALATIVHPNVVRHLEHGQTAEGLDFLVMEWLEGADLAARLSARPLTVDEALTVGLGAARGLAALHQAGVLHRDVKPANLFLVHDRVDDVRVMDLGVARLLDRRTRLTRTGQLVGTPQYMAPEQLRGSEDLRTDVYGLGATLFEALTGAPPYSADQAGALLVAVATAPVPSARAARGELSPALDALLQRMLAKDPADRPEDMAAVATHLAELLSHDQTAASLSLSPHERPAAPTPPSAQPTDAPILGRPRPMYALRGLLLEAREESRAQLVHVIGDRGLGKSTVLAALAQDAAADGWWVQAAAAPRGNTGAPLATVQALLEDGDRADTATRTLRAWLAQPPPPDPIRAADQRRLRWLEYLEATSALGPRLWLIDDAHQADLSSLQLLARALTRLSAHPLVVVLSAPPERAPALATAHAPEVLLLRPLGARTTQALAARWGDGCEAQGVAQAAVLSGGHPGRLRGLIEQLRHHGTAHGAPLDGLRERVAHLSTDARRTLRAAAIVGVEVWPDAVARVLGLAPTERGLARALRELVQHGLLREVRSLRHESRLEFVLEAEQQAAYALSTEDDRRRGHAAMAAWLATRTDASPAWRAEHLALAGEAVAAAGLYLEAARAALAGEDQARLDQLVLAARRCQSPSHDGALCALEAQGLYWRGDVAQALAVAERGLALLPQGSAAWFEVGSLAITAAGQAGANTRVRELAHQLLAAPPDHASAVEQRLVGLCRAASQLYTLGEPEPLLEPALAESGAAERSAEVRAWAARAHSARITGDGLDAVIGAMVRAHGAHVEAGDMRSAALLGIYLGSYYVWSGQWERADEVIMDALRLAERLDVDYLRLWGTYARGKLVSEAGDPAAALVLLTDVAHRSAHSPRIRAGALVYAALAATRAGDLEAARQHAVAAYEAHAATNTRVAARAAEVRARLAAGDDPARLPALSQAPGAPRLPEFDELVWLARAELARAQRSPDADALLAEARDRVYARAATLSNPLHRNHYLERPPLVVRTRELARSALGR